MINRRVVIHRLQTVHYAVLTFTHTLKSGSPIPEEPAFSAVNYSLV